ncbi:MAG: peptide chain release factor N(5)-glutamine methyltransferase [Myxococcaceae bacterium]|nr:MAG: peptide chain release factor N(5)-glutamine methyltransferase [Myxococcaceae bacterium]
MSEQPWTVRRVLGWTAQHFEKLGLDSPRLTAEVLLAHVLRTSRVRLYTDLDRPLEAAELAAYRGLIALRATGEPTHYLTGTREFYGRPFTVDARVLVPRPETELLVEAVLQAIPRDTDVRLLDLCTGSGCVGITLALERPRARVLATDLSPGAAEVARANATTLGVADRFEVRVGDLFAPVEGEAPFDAVVANPPYVPRGEFPTLPAEVRREPAQALDGGPDGLEVVRRIAAAAPRWLLPGGLLALEIGDRQGPAVHSLLEAAGYASVHIERDLARHDRLALGTHPRGPAATHPGDGALGPDPR